MIIKIKYNYSYMILFFFLKEELVIFQKSNMETYMMKTDINKASQLL